MCLCITQVWRIRVHSNCWSPVEWIALRKCSSGQCPGKMSQLDQMLRITLQIFEILSLCREQKKSKICRTNKFGQRPKLNIFSLWGILLVPGKIGWGIVSKKCWSFGLQSFKGKMSMHGRWSWCSASLQKPWCTIQAEDLVQYSWLFWCSTKYSWLRSATETAPALHGRLHCISHIQWRFIFIKKNVQNQKLVGNDKHSLKLCFDLPFPEDKVLEGIEWRRQKRQRLRSI